MAEIRFPATGGEREREWQSSASVKRPRNEYEYDYTRDRSLSGVYVNRGDQDLSVAQRGGDRVGVSLLKDHVRASAPLDDHCIRQQSGMLIPSSGEGLNFRADREKEWQSSEAAKRPCHEYEYDYTRDCSLSGVYVNRGDQDPTVDQRVSDRAGVSLLKDHVRAFPRSLDDHRSVQPNGMLIPSSDEGLNFSADREKEWQSSAPARNEYEYDYTRDRSLSGIYVKRREDLGVGERVGVGLLEDRVRAPAPALLDDHRFVQQNGMLPSSAGGLNFRADSHRPGPPIWSRQAVDDHRYLPEGASNTLFVEGVPSNCSNREVSHIFRPFRGFKEVRVVNKSKESKREGEASVVVVLCFVEFENPKSAATAMAALQGYRFDENDKDSTFLKLEFSRYSNSRNTDRNGSSFTRDRRR